MMMLFSNKNLLTTSSSPSSISTGIPCLTLKWFSFSEIQNEEDMPRLLQIELVTMLQVIVCRALGVGDVVAQCWTKVVWATEAAAGKSFRAAATFDTTINPNHGSTKPPNHFSWASTSANFTSCRLTSPPPGVLPHYWGINVGGGQMEATPRKEGRPPYHARPPVPTIPNPPPICTMISIMQLICIIV